MPETQSERSLIGRIAACERWSREDPTEQGARMRAGFDARFEREIDQEFPDLTPTERARRIAARRSAYFSRLALRSAQARRRGSRREAS